MIQNEFIQKYQPDKDIRKDRLLRGGAKRNIRRTFKRDYRMGFYRIAGLTVQFDYHFTHNLQPRLAPYVTDECEHPDMVMTSQVVGEIKSIPNIELTEAGPLMLGVMPDGRRFRGVRSKSGEWRYTIITTPDYREAEILLHKDLKNRHFELSEYEYIYTCGAFSNRVAHLGGVALHGSAIKFKNKAIAFSGVSGAGKSTHTALWRDRFGDRVDMINDDRPIIRFESDEPYAHGAPWSGTSPLNNPICAPLAAVVYVQQGETNVLRPLSLHEKIFHLTNHIARPAHDAALGARILETTERLLTVPAYLLVCTKDQKAVDAALGVLA